jgi:hypothetical protein
MAGVGLVPALVTLVIGIRGRMRVWPWFCVTALVYGAWALYANSAFG